MEEYNRMLDKQDKMRADEWEKRESKIKKSMARMGDVMKKSDAAEKEFEARIVRDQILKDKEAEAREKKKREEERKRDRAMIAQLGV